MRDFEEIMLMTNERSRLMELAHNETNLKKRLKLVNQALRLSDKRDELLLKK